MILHLVSSPNADLLKKFRANYPSSEFERDGTRVCVLSSKLKELPDEYAPLFSEKWVLESDIQLASTSYLSETRELDLHGTKIGGQTDHTCLIAGPCSVESREQLWTTAKRLKKCGIRLLRGGAFKPRTSPYTFQGLGQEGLDLLAEARAEFGFGIVSEVRDSTHVDAVLETVDVVQIGAKAMYDHGILKACGSAKKPVLLKRGFGSTLQEFVQAAEFVLSSGNEQVMLCERGIRTFETKTRFTLDLCGVAYLKAHTNLPVIVDPSHAMGHRYGVADLTRASVAMGVDGLLVEAHPDPSVAQSDAAQQLDLDSLESLKDSLNPIAEAVGRKIV